MCIALAALLLRYREEGRLRADGRERFAQIRHAGAPAVIRIEPCHDVDRVKPPSQAASENLPRRDRAADGTATNLSQMAKCSAMYGSPFLNPSSEFSYQALCRCGGRC